MTSIKINILFLMLLALGNGLSAQNINPEILWATYFGSPADDFTGGIITDKEDNIYMTSTVKSGSPTTPGVHKTTYGGGAYDIMLTKFSSEGKLIWSTYFGGNGSDESYTKPRLLSDGAIAICGNTSSTNGIATTGAYNINYKGNVDDFIAVFEPNGKLRWATYFGHSGDEAEPTIDIDSDDNIIITGYTSSTVGISTEDAFQVKNKGGYDGFIAKFDKVGKLIWSTYFGGQGDDFLYSIKVDTSNNILVGGIAGSANLATTGAFMSIYGGNRDGILVKLDQNGKKIWSTYFGSSGVDEVYYLNVDGKNDIYIMGPTTSTGNIASAGSFSLKNAGKQDVFLAKFNTDGNRLWSTFFGGEEWDTAFNCDFDNENNIYINFMTKSLSLPVSIDVIGEYHNGGEWDAGFVKFSSTGNMEWATYFGGIGNDRGIDLCLDSLQNIIASVNSDSEGLATSGAYNELASGNESLLLKMREVGTVDVKELEKVTQMSIFPNPACNFIEIPNPTFLKRDITIYNSTGEMVLRYFNSETIRFNISNLAKGAYYVCSYDKKQQLVGRFVKVN